MGIIQSIHCRYVVSGKIHAGERIRLLKEAEGLYPGNHFSLHGTQNPESKIIDTLTTQGYFYLHCLANIFLKAEKIYGNKQTLSLPVSIGVTTYLHFNC